MMDVRGNIIAVLGGNPLAFEPIIEKYKNKVYCLALWWFGDSLQAERVTQECFVHVYRKLNTYQDTEFFSVWFCREILKELEGVPVKSEAEEGAFKEEGLFNHPHHEKVKESILSLPLKTRLPLLVNYLSTQLDDRQAADILDMSMEDYHNSLFSARMSLRMNVLETSEHEQKAGCLKKEELIQYHNGDLYQQRARVEDHLEFCPACREILEVIEREELVLGRVLQMPKLDAGFNEEVLKQLSPYEQPTTSIRSWKYQLGVVGGMVALLLIGFVIIPTIAPWTKMVSNYLNHGSFYNVWADGTYTATSNDISVEITSVDVDPLQMLVHYKVSSDNKDIDYLGENDLFSVHAMDEEGNTYPMETAKPVLIGEMLSSSKIPESSDDRSLYVKALNEESLPGEFNLHFHFQRVKGWGGDWKIVVPIHYEKVVEDVEVLELNQVEVIDDKIEVEIISLEKGKYGSRLTYDVRLKEEEIQRIETNLKKTDQKYDSHFSMSHHNVFAGVVLVNNEEEYMVPIEYPSMYNYMQKAPFQIDFSKLYTDKNYMEVKGNETESGKYSAEIRTANYQEPGFYSMTVPIEKSTDESLNIDLDGYTLNKLSVTRKEGLTTKVLLTGNRTQNHKVRNFSWVFSDENGQRLDIHNRSGYDWFDQEENPEIEMINVNVKSDVTHLMIQAVEIFNDYIFREKEYRIPLE